MSYKVGNLTSGEVILTFSELVQLAKDKKSVMMVSKRFESVVYVRPAAFAMNWSAWELDKWNIFKTVRNETKGSR